MFELHSWVRSDSLAQHAIWGDGMRLRPVKNEKLKLAQHPYVINDPKQYCDHWHEYFMNHNPIAIEIGMGKGQFVAEMARLHQNVNFIGIEKYSKVLVRALQRFTEPHTEKIALLCLDAKELGEVFAEGEVDQIYLNFSDPWPKARHAKRRLTHFSFLTIYQHILRPEGSLQLKTDNQAFFAYSLEQLEALGWQIKYITHNLHCSDFPEDNVMTEYESKFLAAGKPIYKLIAKLPQVNSK